MVSLFNLIIYKVHKISHFVASSVFVIFLGLIGRIYLVLNVPLWIDEKFTQSLMHNNFLNILSGKLDRTHPPGYYIFLKLWSLLSFNSLYLRINTLILFVLNAILIYYLGKSLNRQNFARSLLFIYVFSGFFVTFDWQIRMYSLLTCLILLSLILSQQKNIYLKIILLIIVNLTGLLTDYGYLFYLVPFIIFQFLVWIRVKKAYNQNLFISALISFLLFLILWLPNFINYFNEGIKGISWLTNFSTSYFYGPFFLGSFDQFIMTSIFITLLVCGIYFTVVLKKNMIEQELFFISAFSLISTKLISVFYTLILHVRSLQIVGIAIVFLLSTALEQFSQNHKYIPTLFKFVYVVNFFIVIYYIPRHPGIYLISFR